MNSGVIDYHGSLELFRQLIHSRLDCVLRHLSILQTEECRGHLLVGGRCHVLEIFVIVVEKIQPTSAGFPHSSVAGTLGHPTRVRHKL
jgi:hypothetical protein